MVDILLIPAKYAHKIVFPQEIIDRLPKKLMMFSSVQFLDQLPDIQKCLEGNGKKIIMQRSRNFLYEGLVSEKGQLLGCNMEDYSAKDIDFEAFLYIGDGVFHPKALLVNNEKDIYCYDPKLGKLNMLDRSLHSEYAKRIKGSVLKFLSSRNIGIIISTKAGQGSPKRAESLKRAIEERWPDKCIYMFYASDISFPELENYNFIDTYVNVACSRIGHDDTKRTAKPIINVADVEKLLQK